MAHSFAHGIQEERPHEDLSEASLNDLVGRLTRQLTSLMQDELRLAQVEMTAKAKRAGVGAGLFGGVGVLGLFGLGALVAAAIIALAGPIPGWAAALVVAGALFVVAGLAGSIALFAMKAASPPIPTEALDSVKQDVQAVKGRAS